MTRTARPTLLVALALCLSAGGAAADDAHVLPGDVDVARVSQQDWSRRWWEWAGSFERADSPLTDASGAICGSKQAGDVWFLAGTYGSRRAVRTCRVAAGKHLFFPLITYVAARGSGREVSCASVTRSAARATERVSALVLEVDGIRYEDLARHRLATRECFDLGARTAERLTIYPAAANGYYVMLKPLPPGTHTLHFGGALPSLLQAVTYTLIVE